MICEKHKFVSLGEMCPDCFPGPKDHPVEHPSHYTYGKIEAIEVIEDWDLGFHKGNALKYLCRAGKKDPQKEIQDLRKAIWYLNRYITQIDCKSEPSK